MVRPAAEQLLDAQRHRPGELDGHPVLSLEQAGEHLLLHLPVERDGDLVPMLDKNGIPVAYASRVPTQQPIVSNAICPSEISPTRP